MNARAQAARNLAGVIEKGQSLGAILDAPANKQHPNAGLVSELSYGVLRHYFSLRALSNTLLSKALKSRDTDVLCLIMVGLYQLIYLRVPDHAAINETVAATRDLRKKWAKGLTNAILRKYQRESEHLLKSISDDPEVSHEHPAWLLRALQVAWPDDWQAIVVANNARAPMTLRVNLAVQNRLAYLEQLSAEDIQAQAVRRADSAVQLAEPCQVDRLPGFADGKLSVQDAAAQLAAVLLAPQAGERLLDACAAPGGKSAHLLERLASQGVTADLLALDNDERRLARVAETLERLGLEAELVCANAAEPASWWDGKLFDRILLDAPCSATGVIRRHADIKLLRRETDIQQLVATQSGLLRALWPLLKPGGRLVYATCSVLPAENVGQLSAFLEQNGDANEIMIQAAWGHSLKVGRQIFPGEDGMDGFYYAIVEKVG